MLSKPSFSSISKFKLTSISVIIELALPLYKHIDQGDEHQIIILKALYVFDGFGQNIFIVTVSDKLSWQ